jgi:carboxyl-terminal processing protease
MGWIRLGMVVVVALMFARLPQMVAQQDSVVHTFGTLVEVDALVKSRFVEPIQDDRLVDGAIRGMMYKLDPYSSYISPEQQASFQRRQEGEYVGIGVSLGLRNGRPAVIAPLESSPADVAGLLPGDRILAVDNRDTEGLSIFEVEEMLTGEAGTSVQLTIARSDQEEPLSVTLTRRAVSMRVVRGFRRDIDGFWDYLLDPAAGVGYLRLSKFRANSAEELDEAFAVLRAAGARALILDLRFNPGGLMEQGLSLVDRFVAEGVLLSTITRREAVQTYRAHGPGTDQRTPLVVLINGGSASSSEIVAGSLQDHSRATIVGGRSFGKGSVQHLIPLADGEAAVKLTVAYYRLPRGRIIHRTAANLRSDRWGIVPDIAVPMTDAETKAVRQWWSSWERNPGGPADRMPTVGADGARAEASSREALDLPVRATARHAGDGGIDSALDGPPASDRTVGAPCEVFAVDAQTAELLAMDPQLRAALQEAHRLLGRQNGPTPAAEAPAAARPTP